MLAAFRTKRLLTTSRGRQQDPKASGLLRPRGGGGLNFQRRPSLAAFLTFGKSQADFHIALAVRALYCIPVPYTRYTPYGSSSATSLRRAALRIVSMRLVLISKDPVQICLDSSPAGKWPRSFRRHACGPCWQIAHPSAVMLAVLLSQHQSNAINTALQPGTHM